MRARRLTSVLAVALALSVAASGAAGTGELALGESAFMGDPAGGRNIQETI